MNAIKFLFFNRRGNKALKRQYLDLLRKVNIAQNKSSDCTPITQHLWVKKDVYPSSPFDKNYLDLDKNTNSFSSEIQKKCKYIISGNYELSIAYDCWGEMSEASREIGRTSCPDLMDRQYCIKEDCPGFEKNKIYISDKILAKSELNYAIVGRDLFIKAVKKKSARQYKMLKKFERTL